MRIETYRDFLDNVTAMGSSSPVGTTINARVLLPTYGWLEGGVTCNANGFLAIDPVIGSGLHGSGAIFVDLEDVIAIQAI